MRLSFFNIRSIDIFVSYTGCTFKPLHSKTNQELYENTPITKVTTMSNTNGATCPSERYCAPLSSAVIPTYLCYSL